MRKIKYRAWDIEAKEMNTVQYPVGFDEVELMQYTGIKDKNSVEIYEGDVVKIQVNNRLDWNNIIGKVVFLEGAWIVEDVGNFAIELWSEVNEIEIIGNVYQNPELLKGGTEMNDNLFEFKDEEFKAKNIDAAMTRFLDEAWGVHYVDYLKEKGEGSHIKSILAVENIEDNEYQNYYLLKQKLENGDILKFEVWINDDGTYKGLAQEVTA